AAGRGGRSPRPRSDRARPAGTAARVPSSLCPSGRGPRLAQTIPRPALAVSRRFDQPASLQPGDRRVERPRTDRAVERAHVVEQQGHGARPVAERDEDAPRRLREPSEPPRVDHRQSATITPQAIRPPLPPVVASVTWSSSLAWMMKALPTAPDVVSNRVVGPSVSVTRSVVASRCATPSVLTIRFGRSPAWAPAGFRSPCCRVSGL